jgi:hypothetical protein
MPTPFGLTLIGRKGWLFPGNFGGEGFSATTLESVIYIRE